MCAPVSMCPPSCALASRPPRPRQTMWTSHCRPGYRFRQPSGTGPEQAIDAPSAIDAALIIAGDAQARELAAFSTETTSPSSETRPVNISELPPPDAEEVCTNLRTLFRDKPRAIGQHRPRSGAQNRCSRPAEWLGRGENRHFIREPGRNQSRAHARAAFAHHPGNPRAASLCQRRGDVELSRALCRDAK